MVIPTLAILLLGITANVYADTDCNGSCGQGEGDCDWNSDCLPGLICKWDWWWGTDYCEAGPDTKNYEWGPWGDWGDCEGNCDGMGEKVRHRPCIPPRNGGYECPAAVDSALEECATEPCPIHCEWGEWVLGECSTTCGEGIRIDTREKTIEGKHGGEECIGAATVSEHCHAGDCPPPTNPRCNPSTWEAYDNECCSAEEPCGLGEGDCDSDDECAGAMVCGKNNCLQEATEFTPQADCCEFASVEGQGNPNCIPSGLPAFADLPGQDNWLLKECCSEERPCGVGEGDCDHDNECEGELTCGRNNCVDFPSSRADCCE